MNRRIVCVVLAVFFWGLNVTLIRARAQRETDVPILQGSFAVQLSTQDITNIERVLPPGAKPWLLGGGDCLFCEAMIAAYLPPTTQTAELRRGRVLVLQPPAGLIKGGMPARNAPTSWVLTDKTGLYAQLPPVGQPFDPAPGTRRGGAGNDPAAGRRRPAGHRCGAVWAEASRRGGAPVRLTRPARVEIPRGYIEGSAAPSGRPMQLVSVVSSPAPGEIRVGSGLASARRRTGAPVLHHPRALSARAPGRRSGS